MTAPSVQSSAQVPAARYTGDVIYLYAFDVGYEVVRGPIGELLGQKVSMFQMDMSSKRTPRQFFFYRPQVVTLPALERFTDRGPVRIERSVKIFPVGAISLTVRIPFATESIHELVELHDLRYSNGGSLHEDMLATAEEVREALVPYIDRPVGKLADEEAYTVFAIHAPVSEDARLHSAENWLEANRRQVAALLTEEYELAHLSNQEADESTGRYLSYYDHNLVVVDWDAALVIDEPRYIDETVYLMELANLQLAELEAYDRILDDVVDRAYRDLSGRRRAQGTARTLRELREIRVDFARVTDELENITKFFGDWHLARIYKTVASRFHLADWQRTIDDKLATLNDLYRLLQEDRNHRTMMLLELTVVIFFLIELVPLIYAILK